jgi:hypothetical protein
VDWECSICRVSPLGTWHGMANESRVKCMFSAQSPLFTYSTHHPCKVPRLHAALCWPQADALAYGKTPEQLRAENVPDYLIPHRSFTGGRGTTPTQLVVRYDS